MRKPAGFWKRPTNRIYHYNLDMGENYYAPMTHYLDSQYGPPSYGGAPGALTYTERLANRWMQSGQSWPSQDSYSYYRSSSMTRDSSPYSGYNYSYSRRAMSDPPVYGGGCGGGYGGAYGGGYGSGVGCSTGDYHCPGIIPWEPHRDVNNVSAFGCYKQALLDTSDELRSNAMTRQANRGSGDPLAALRAARHANQTFSQPAFSRPQEVYQPPPPPAQPRFAPRRPDAFVSAWSYGPGGSGLDPHARATMMGFDRELDGLMSRATTSRTQSRQAATNICREAMLDGSSTFYQSRKAMAESARRMGWR